MKISDFINGIPVIRGRETRKTKNNSGDTSAAPSNSDSVELTSISTQLGKLEDELASLPAEDTNKVEAIKQAISDGTFQVDEEAVADALIQNSFDQIRRQGKQ